LPCPYGPRSSGATVGAEQTSTGRFAPHHPHSYLKK